MVEQRRRDIDSKYDYRYSVLASIFGVLLAEGWLSEEDLSGLEPPKVEAIRRWASFGDRTR